MEMQSVEAKLNDLTHARKQAKHAKKLAKEFGASVKPLNDFSPTGQVSSIPSSQQPASKQDKIRIQKLRSRVHALAHRSQTLAAKESQAKQMLKEENSDLAVVRTKLHSDKMAQRRLKHSLN